ncbi:amphi-Trp domain-containing protein [Desulfatirhabdium butyrativorans]|jgi:amphi-Trp domain-containing protein|uniref:amphi-Trp domain-containing protein n=1 Tax=Desulfatirhabdium butyrativorans TaxID=340467 RepID=UPI000402F06A|nr:amphi-Trp domain-containing protein [Desulfatirhabdium butyrativorans]
MSEMEKFDYEAVQDRETMRQYLNTLIEGIENGKILLRSEKESVLLAPTELIRFSLKAKRKPGKSKITIKLSWNDFPSDILRDKGNAIQIST